MHEDSPKMSVAQGLVASTSQAKSEIVFEGAVEYEMATEAKPAENITLEIKIPYVESTAGTYSTSHTLYLPSNYKWLRITLYSCIISSRIQSVPNGVSYIPQS